MKMIDTKFDLYTHLLTFFCARRKLLFDTLLFPQDLLIVDYSIAYHVPFLLIVMHCQITFQAKIREVSLARFCQWMLLMMPKGDTLIDLNALEV